MKNLIDPGASGAPTPWYRVPEMWLVVALPLSAVIGGFVTLALAIVSDDGLVDDDYYQRGKEINLVLQRDRAAQGYGLAGSVEFDYANGTLRARLQAQHLAALPPRVHLKLMYATRAGLDQAIDLNRAMDGSYHGLLPKLQIGHWYVQAEADDWRLVGSMRVPDETRIKITPSQTLS
jgi:uncharacterized protein